MKPGSAPWVVLVPNGGDATVECRRCGDVQRIAFPMSIDLFDTTIGHLIKKHRKCKPPKGGADGHVTL